MHCYDSPYPKTRWYDRLLVLVLIAGAACWFGGCLVNELNKTRELEYNMKLKQWNAIHAPNK